MKQQSAVEWLVNEIAEKYNFRCATYYGQEIQQAKEMEKEQIVKAVYDSMGNNFDPNMGRAEMYYKENYGGEK